MLIVCLFPRAIAPVIMEYYKHDVFSSGVELHSLDGHDTNVFGGTRHDEYDMTRMGKKQELQVR